MERSEARPRGVAALPEHQRACLRRVLDHKSSKVIALELGISPHTVDQRLKGAMQSLGVSSRVDAARLLAQYEASPPSPPLVYQCPDIAALGISPSGEVTRGDGEGIAHRRTVVREERAPFITSVRSHPWPGELPLRRNGGRIQDLSALQRLGWVVVIMMGIALSTGMFLAGTNALVELALSAGRHPN